LHSIDIVISLFPQAIIRLLLLNRSKLYLLIVNQSFIPNTGPLLALHRTFTIGMRLCFVLWISLSMISTGSSMK